MEPKGILLSEIGQTERQTLCDLTYTWTRKRQKSRITESRMVVTRGWGRGRAGRVMQGYEPKGTNFQLRRRRSRSDLTYSMVTRVNNTLLHTRDVLREEILSVLTIEKEVAAMYCDGGSS